MEKIILNMIEGEKGKRSGIEQHIGHTWRETAVEGFACEESNPGEGCSSDECPCKVEECSICNKKISRGWLCTDDNGREFVCDDHIFPGRNNR